FSTRELTELRLSVGAGTRRLRGGGGGSLLGCLRRRRGSSDCERGQQTHAPQSNSGKFHVDSLPNRVWRGLYPESERHFKASNLARARQSPIECGLITTLIAPSIFSLK